MTSDKELLNDNPLMVREGLPPFDKINPKHIVPAMDATLELIEKQLAEVENNIVPTYDGLIKKLEELDGHFEYTWGPINHLSSVMNSDEMRKAYEQVLPKVIAFSLRFSQSIPIYKGIKAIKDSPDFEKLNSAKKRIIDSKLKSAENSGVGLEGEEKERFNEIANQCSKLSTDFSNNILDATKAFELIIEDPKDIEGWPTNLRQLAAQSYTQEKEEKNQKPDPENGPWRITLDFPSFGPFMKHSRNRNQRKQVYMAMVTKASSGKFDNTEIVKKLLKLRQEKAKMLGFKNFAELSLDTKMAPNVQAVEKMSIELEKYARPAAKRDLNEELEIASEYLGNEEV